jgi:hypothetical protein
LPRLGLIGLSGLLSLLSGLLSLLLLSFFLFVVITSGIGIAAGTRGGTFFCHNK